MVGFVINRFRGDLALLQPGLDWLEQRTGKPVLGVLPYLQGLHLEAEDALPRAAVAKPQARLRVVVPALPRISNHNDFDALAAHPQVDLRFIGPGQAAGLRLDRAARQQVDPRRPGLAARTRLGSRSSPATCVTGAACSAFAAASRCWGRRCSTRPVSRALPVAAKAWDGWRWTRASRPTSNCAACKAGSASPMPRCAATKSIAEPAAVKHWAGPSRSSMAAATMARSRPTARSWAPICMGSSTTRPRALPCSTRAGLANADALDLDALRERTFERLADMVEQHLDTTALSRWLALPPR